MKEILVAEIVLKLKDTKYQGGDVIKLKRQKYQGGDVIKLKERNIREET